MLSNKETQSSDFLRTCAGALGYAIRPFLLVARTSGHKKFFDVIRE